MPALTALFGPLLALLAAALYGGADFSGGLAARKQPIFLAQFVISSAGLACAATAALLLGERLPPLSGMLWAALAGACGTLGSAALYYGLAHGQTPIVAPIAAVVGAVTPVLYAALDVGLPPTGPLLGFALALPGIALVSGGGEGGAQGSAALSQRMGGLAGLGFGAFFICMAQVEGTAIFAPLIATRTAALAFGYLLARRIHHLRPVPADLRANPAALLTGLLDVLATGSYLFATQLARLDVAVVLTSLYPAGTLLLAWLVLRERIGRSQWVGVALCLAAVALISG
jgi:drug/metabolite transporter (DMT)-like permease